MSLLDACPPSTAGLDRFEGEKERIYPPWVVEFWATFHKDEQTPWDIDQDIMELVLKGRKGCLPKMSGEVLWRDDR